jgi:hypothetical protein
VGRKRGCDLVRECGYRIPQCMAGVRGSRDGNVLAGLNCFFGWMAPSHILIKR